MMIINNKYEIGQIVYLTTDEEQKQRIITEIKILPNDLIIYNVACGSSGCDCYELEISAEKDVINAI